MADFVFINPEYADYLRAQGLLNLRRLLDWSEGACVGRHGPREVWQIDLADAPGGRSKFYLRKDRRVAWREILLDLLRFSYPASRSLKTMQGIAWLDQIGLETMELVCLIERQTLGLPRKAAALVTAVEGRDLYAVLRAFGASLISTHIDGLEGVYSPANPDLLDISPADYTPYPRVCSEGDSVAAGSAVFREVQNLRTNLLVFAEVPEDAAPGAGSRVRVRFPRLATEAVPAAVIGSRRRPDISADTWAFHIALDRYATTLTDLRSESVTLVTERVSGLLIPRSALARKGDDDGVWLLRTNRFIWRSVTVLGMNEEEAAVEGIREGDRVLCRPR